MEIYLITNVLNNKKYVGQTIYTKEERFKGHMYGKQYIDKDIQTYGRENFQLQTLETVRKASDLDKREEYWIKKINTMYPDGYNLTPGGKWNFAYSMSFDIGKYITNMFYPPQNGFTHPKRVKMYVMSYDNYFKLSDISEESFSNACDTVLYFPSLSKVIELLPDGYCVYGYHTYSHMQKIIKTKEEIELNNSRCGVLFYNNNDMEYNRYAMHEIERLLNFYNENPKQLEELLQWEKFKKETSRKLNIEKQERLSKTKRQGGDVN